MNHILFAGALVLGAQLSAQETTRWDVGGALLMGLDGLKSVTGNSQGTNLQAGFNGHIANSDVPFRASLQVYTMPWNGNDPANTGLRDVQLAGDIFTQTPFPRLRLLAGLSLNKWYRGESKTSVKGIKFGGRLGVDYELASHWTAEFTVQAAELGTDAYATKGLNPSWAQLGVRYRF
jgi:hypothetical protein